MKKNNYFKIFLTSIFTLVIFIGSYHRVSAAFAGGDGSQGNPYQIATCQQLQDIQTSLSSYYVLTQDIDCSDTVNWNEGQGFNSIGTNANAFQGTLNGAGYKVSNLTINNPSDNEPSVFGAIGSGGVVEYINFEDITITETDGTAAGVVYDLQLGGIVRYVSVSGGNITGGGAAGIANTIRFGSELYDSYVINTNLTGIFVSAGIAISVGSESSINRTYAVASHGGSPEVKAGIVGYNDASVTDSFYDQTVSGVISDGGGVPKTTEEMQMTLTFTDADWDFDTIWDRDDAYPFLRVPQVDGPVVPFSGNGSGTEISPYIITTCEQLQEMNNHLDAHFELGGNINCSTTATWNANTAEWVDGIVDGDLIQDDYTGVINNGYFGFDPIGRDDFENDGYGFTGTFDGNGYTISNLWIFRKNQENVGLFGYTGNAEIRNVRITNANIVGGDYTGGIIGYATGTEIDDVRNTNGMVRAYLAYEGGGIAGTLANESILTNAQTVGGMVHGSGNIIGGLVGAVYDSTVIGSTTSADVDGGEYIGGAFGKVRTSTIDDVHATGGVIANLDEGLFAKSGRYSGGFAGSIEESVVTNSSATGTVTGVESVGGFVGESFLDSEITDSYATGNVTATGSTVGGFVGGAYCSVSFIRTYASGNVITNGDYVGGFVGSDNCEGPAAYYEQSAALGNVTGGDDVGGFIGNSVTSDFLDVYVGGDVIASGYTAGGFGGYIINAKIDNAYSRGSVTASGEEVGSFIGYHEIGENDRIITDSFYNSQTSGQPIGCGYGDCTAVIPKTTNEMKIQSTFTDAGWDFNDIWEINSDNEGYAHFQWQTFGDDSEDPDPQPQPRRRTVGGMASAAFLARNNIILANQAGNTQNNQVSPSQCPPDQLLTQNLRTGARNGRFHSYTQGIVTQANILQAHLNRLGFNSGPVDGILGPISDGAIKRMQTFLGTKPDGFVGPITRGLLNNSCGSNGLQNG